MTPTLQRLSHGNGYVQLPVRIPVETGTAYDGFTKENIVLAVDNGLNPTFKHYVALLKSREHYDRNLPPIFLPSGICLGELSRRTHLDLANFKELNSPFSEATFWAHMGFLVGQYDPRFATHSYRRFAGKKLGIRNTLEHKDRHKEPNFDTFYRDLLPIIRFLLDYSGSDGIHMNGYSLGGMATIALLVHFDAELRDKILSATMLATPFIITDEALLIKIMNFYRYAQKWLPVDPSVPVIRNLPEILQRLRNRFPRAARVVAQKFPLLPYLTTFDDVDPGVLANFVFWGVEATNMRLLLQLWHQHKTKTFKSRDGKVDFIAGLPQIRNPILGIKGGKDRLATAAGIEPYFAQIGTAVNNQDVRLETNDGANHIDLLIARYVPRQVWLRSLNWVLEHTDIDGDKKRKIRERGERTVAEWESSLL